MDRRGVHVSEETAVMRLPWRTRAAIVARLFAVQGSWNYESMVGNGIAFSLAPALRRLPGGAEGDAYRSAMAREARYFNAHPYLTSVAVGALARVELDGAPPERIERFRAALCGPLGSLGDRLVWAGWLPLCATVALFAFALGASPLAVALLFLLPYNAGHIALRGWGLDAGWRHGFHVAGALATPLFRDGPRWLAAVNLVLASVTLPLTVRRLLGDSGGTVPSALGVLAGTTVAVAIGLAVIDTRTRGRVEGWKAALALLAAAALFVGLR
jgi:mannose PTS system EIID component